MQCQNNLKQIGLALHNYHDAYSCFPAGGVTNGTCCHWQGGPSWGVSILPFIEQGNLYTKYDPTKTVESSANAFLRTQFIKTYNCPSDPNINMLLVPASGTANDGGLQYATSSYRGVAGVTNGDNTWFDAECGRNQPVGRRGVLHSMSDPNYPTPFPAKYAAPPYGRETIASITDGTSNTAMVGEYSTRTMTTRGSFWAYEYTSFAMSELVLPPQSRQLYNDYNACVSVDPNTAFICKRGFASFHTGIINFCFADGSVHAISTSVDMIQLAAMFTIANGEVVAGP
jgi:hypothetical protein